jgi:hypothetical protein
MFRSCLAAVAAVAVGLMAGAAFGADDVQKEFDAFLQSPSKESYRKVFAILAADPKYNPYSGDLDEVGELLEKNEFRRARERLQQSMPNLLLSPRAHRYASLAAEGLGETEEAKRRDEVAAKCLRGIMSTGDGTQRNPYLVSRTSDEYDVLRSLKKQMRFQDFNKVEKEGDGGRTDYSYYDVLKCVDGSQVWFDVTVAYRSLGRRIHAK